MRLKNRKRYFTQWDKGQVLICDECPRGTQIHFSNTRSELAYVVETDSNLEAEVPDILLQEPYPITAWIYREENGIFYTENRREIQVIKRPRPESYVYTDEERMYWESKVDENWGVENAGKFLVVGENGIVTVSSITDVTISDKYFCFEQAIPSNNWIIVHGLEKHPSVTVVDSAGTIITGEVTYIDMNTLRIDFQAAFSGKAYLN